MTTETQGALGIGHTGYRQTHTEANTSTQANRQRSKQPNTKYKYIEKHAQALFSNNNSYTLNYHQETIKNGNHCPDDSSYPASTWQTLLHMIDQPGPLSSL